MNRSLILVMCDVLVLSAMSLSTGAFVDSEDDGARDSVSETQTDAVVQTSAESPLVATNAPSEIGTRQMELANAVSNLAYQLNCATSELAKASKDFGTVTNDLVRLRMLADSYSNKVARTMLDVEAAREQVKKSEAERDRAEAGRKSAEAARRKAEEEAESANSNLAAAREEVQTLATARDKAESERKKAVEQGEEWKVKYDGVYREYALPELERKKRMDTIRRSIVQVWIEKKNGEVEAPFFSPVVAIGSSRFVLALRDRGDLKKVKRVSFRSVLPGEYGTTVSGEAAHVFRMRVPPSSWYEPSDPHFKCAFFPIDAQGLPCLTLGIEEWQKSNMKHVISCSSGGIRNAGHVGGIRNTAKEYWNCKAGDFVVDEAGTAIEKIFHRYGHAALEFNCPLTLYDLGDAHPIGQE